MGFKEDYAKFSQPSLQREQFVYNSIINSISKDQLIKSMKPVTVNRSDGSKIVYTVMPDYISIPSKEKTTGKIEYIRVPMSGNTAQRVADHFGLNLPTAAMAKEIYHGADVKVTAKPLSGSGAVIDGKRYSGNDVVNTGVGYAPFALSYNDNIAKQLAEHGAKEDQIVSGFAKDIVAPAKEGHLGLYGLFDSNGKAIQGGNGQTPHDTDVHTEYGSFLRLVSPDVTITYPDGKKEIKPTSTVYNANTYSVKKDDKAKIYPHTQSASGNKPIVSAPVEFTPGKPESGRSQILQRIENFINEMYNKI
jgi:hypothetical protein